jgi:hypothetical protein
MFGIGAFIFLEALSCSTCYSCESHYLILRVAYMLLNTFDVGLDWSMRSALDLLCAEEVTIRLSRSWRSLSQESQNALGRCLVIDQQAFLNILSRLGYPIR